MAVQWCDSPIRYGLVSRSLHGAMALLFTWQFLGMGLKLALGRTPVTAVFVGSHVPIGSILMGLMLLRALWALLNLRRRPSQGTGIMGFAARAGHAGLYLLMFVVPVLAGLRAYGSGRGLQVWGLPVLPATGERLDWAMAPGNALHGLLAWVLLCLIAGHILMAVLHRVVWRDDVLSRMFGRARSAAS